MTNLVTKQTLTTKRSSIPASSLNLFLKSAKNLQKDLVAPSGEIVVFKWRYLLDFFNLISEINSFITTIPNSILSPKEAKLKQFVLHHSEHLILDLKSPNDERTIISPNNILFNPEILETDLNTGEKNPIPSARETAITMRELVTIKCFDTIFDLHSFFNSFLVNNTKQLVEKLEGLR